jgi:cobyrinic acid a,c-diamide synthase
MASCHPGRPDPHVLSDARPSKFLSSRRSGDGSMAHLYISAAQKSSGKTTLSIGLCRAWRDAGVRVQPFKKGPDYIDPLWLTEACSRPCYNLDFHTMRRAEILDAFAHELDTADLGLIEGNVGLFDSIDPAGSNSNAELAKLLGAPVVLVINCHGMGRGIVPLLLGYQAFDRSSISPV